jgi:multidrug resistance efflux pump
VRNLLTQLGDYVNVGVNTISVADTNSFWVDRYFEEMNLAPIHVGDPAQISLMIKCVHRSHPSPEGKEYKRCLGRNRQP